MKLGMRATELMTKLFGRAARAGSLGIRDNLEHASMGWVRSHQGAREMMRRQRQAAAIASKAAARAVAEQAAEAL
jgi:hypothetical protein